MGARAAGRRDAGVRGLSDPGGARCAGGRGVLLVAMPAGGTTHADLVLGAADVGGADGRPLAEAPNAQGEAMRDLALQVADADRRRPILFGAEFEGAPPPRSATGAAHAAATFADRGGAARGGAARGARRPWRRGDARGASQGAAAVAGHRARERHRARVKAALGGLGVPTGDAPASTRGRDLEGERRVQRDAARRGDGADWAALRATSLGKGADGGAGGRGAGARGAARADRSSGGRALAWAGSCATGSAASRGGRWPKAARSPTASPARALAEGASAASSRRPARS